MWLGWCGIPHQPSPYRVIVILPFSCLSTHLQVLVVYPQIEITAKWQIFNGSTQIGCFEVPLKIVRPSEVV